MSVDYYLVFIREGLLCGIGVEPPRGRGRLSGVPETQLFLRSNQCNLVGYTDLIFIMWTLVVMGLRCTCSFFLIGVIDSMKGFSRCRGYWSICCLFVVCDIYIYKYSAGYVELPIVLICLLRRLVYHMMSKTRRNSTSLHRVIAYICYIYSMLGVSHGVQNEKKLWKFTQSNRWCISARSAGGE